MENKDHKDIRKQIMHKAETMFKRLGIKSVSMDDIARELGISKKTLYQYFENKEDLLLQAIQSHIDDEKNGLCEMQNISTDAVGEMMLIAKHAIEEFRELSPSIIFDLQKYYPQAWALIEKQQNEHIYGVMLQNLQRGIASQDYRADLNPEIMARLHVGGIQMPVNHELFPTREFSPEQVFKEYIYHFMRGIVSEQGLQKMNAYLQQAKKAEA
jgi:TetR/AcrR family transcriptional regulator, cholesterol catabolism regulator